LLPGLPSNEKNSSDHHNSYNKDPNLVNKYSEEPIYIFTDSLNSLYLINTQIKHPTLHTNHPNKTILIEIVIMLQEKTQPISLHKVRAHTKIARNKMADLFAKISEFKPHLLPYELHEFSHSIPYYLHKEKWIGMHRTPYKGPI
jgi:hypothetical protein